MDEASAHPRASPRLCHRNAPTWAANLSLPPGHCAHPRPGHTSRPWSAERVVRPLPTSPVSFHTLRHIRFSSVPQMHHEPLAPRGLCTCKPLWFGFPRPPYALLILPPSTPLVKLQHRFFRGPSLAHGTGYLLAQHYAFLCRPRCLQTRMCLRLMPGLPAPDAKATEGGQGLFCSS